MYLQLQYVVLQFPLELQEAADSEFALKVSAEEVSGES